MAMRYSNQSGEKKRCISIGRNGMKSVDGRCEQARQCVPGVIRRGCDVSTNEVKPSGIVLLARIIS
jgi:hypothetical protein